jgi:hypothetical protein
MQDGSKAVKAGLGLLVAAVATLAVSASTAKEGAGQSRVGTAPVRSACAILLSPRTLRSYLYAVKFHRNPPFSVFDELSHCRSGWTPKRVLGQVANFAEGVLFSLALGMAG